MARRAPVFLGVLALLVTVYPAATAGAAATHRRATHTHHGPLRTRKVIRHPALQAVADKAKKTKRKPRPRAQSPAAPVLTALLPTPAGVAASPSSPSPAPPSSPSPAPFTPPSAPAALSGGLVVGLNANAAGWGNGSTAPRLDLVTGATGTRWLREEIDWATVEPQPGVFDFSYYDHFMLLAAQRGLHILAVLYDTPAWAGPAYNAIPSDPTAFAQYVSAVVGRYGTNGSFWAENPGLGGSAITTWEIWNEPYLGSGDNGDYDPAAYAELVKAAGSAGHAADPTAKFLIGAEMQSGRDANGNWQWWVDALYQAVPDLNNYFDGVAMHDYGNDTTTLNSIIPGQPYPNYGHILRIEDLRAEFVAHNAAGKPFWITEAGWSTCSDDPTTCVTPAQQATNLAALFNDIHTAWSGYVQGVFVYDYGDGADPTSTQGGYGLTYLDGSPKPALAIFQPEAAGSAN